MQRIKGPYIKDVRPTPPPPGRGLKKPQTKPDARGEGVQRFWASENKEKRT